MRLIARILVLLFVLALLLAIFAPSILSTHLGKHAVCRIIRKMTGYEVYSDTLNLKWFKGQAATHIEVMDPSGRSVFKADSITTTASLWKLLFCHDVGHLQVESPFLVFQPSHQIASTLMIHQAGFIGSIRVAPSIHLLGEISVHQGKAQFITPPFIKPGLDPISMKEIELHATFLPKQIKLQASGLTEEGLTPGMFQINVLAFPGTDQIDASVKLDQFPLRAVDQMLSLAYPEFKGLIHQTIGDHFNAEVKLKNLQEGLEFYLKAKSDYFSADVETTVQDDKVELASPALFQFQIPPPSFEKLTSFSIKNGIHAQLKIDQLSIPLNNRQQLLVQGTLKSEAIQLEEGILDPFTLYIGSSSSKGDWNIKIDSPQVQFHGALNLQGKWENLSFTGEALLPKNTKLDISAPSLSSITLLFQGDIGKGSLKGSFDPHKKTVTLKERSSFLIHLPDLSYALPPLTAQIEIDPCVLQLTPLSGKLKGFIEFPAFNMEAAHVGSTSLHFTGTIQTRELFFSLISSVNESPLKAEGSLKVDPDLKNFENLKMKGSFTHLPVESLQPLIYRGPSLLYLLGNQLTSNFQFLYSQKSSLLQLKTSSPYLALSVALKGNSQGVELLEPATFAWNVTPEGYANLSKWLQGSSTFQLAEPCLFKGTIHALSFSFNQFLNTLEYQAKITSDELVLVQKQPTTKISQIEMSLNHRAPSSPHQFQISARADPKGSLVCKGSWMPTGTADIQLQLEQFPPHAFDVFSTPFVGNRFSVATLCGSSVNLFLTTHLNQWNGPFNFEMHSENLRSLLKGTLTQGVLTLNDKFYLQLNLTKQLSQMLFHSTMENSIDSLRSEGPVSLEIGSEGFSCPLVPYQLEKLQVSTGRLELGKILSRNQGNLQIAMGLLKLGQYRSGDELELWFTPLDFKIRNGILNYERTDVLIASHFQICSWGQINLPKKSVDGTLGLTSPCLNKAFGIKNLPENYVLQIPLQGTLSDIKIDKGKATAKIGTLLLWEQKGSVVGGVVKGPAGKFLGESLNKLGPLPGGDQKAPPPKKPFPWEVGQGEVGQEEKTSSKKKTSDATSHHKKEHRKHIHPEDSALKQLFKLVR